MHYANWKFSQRPHFCCSLRTHLPSLECSCRLISSMRWCIFPSDKCTSSGSGGTFLHTDAPFSALEAEPSYAKIKVKASRLGPELKRTSHFWLCGFILLRNSRSDVLLPPQDTSGLSLCCSGSPAATVPADLPLLYMQRVRASWLLSYLRR